MTSCMELPPRAARVMLSWKVSRTFLRLEEHPPDAHRGWDMPPARLWYHHLTAGNDQDVDVTSGAAAEAAGGTSLLNSNSLTDGLMANPTGELCPRMMQVRVRLLRMFVCVHGCYQW